MKKIFVISVLFVILMTSGCKAKENSKVLIKTSMGDITVELFDSVAPISVENFLKYTDEKLYNGTIFHRVINNFMIQGGGFLPDMTKRKTFSPIKNEADNGFKNDYGTLAMARTGVVDSATSQFFINVKNNDFLNHKGKSAQNYGYAVFGKVVSGIEVVNKMKEVSTGMKGHYRDVPVEDVVIISVERIKAVGK